MTEIGYALSMSHWGRGLMVEALQAAIAFCFKNPELDAITIGHFTINQQSRRVIEKCGFTFVKRGSHFAEQMQATYDDLRYIVMPL